RLGEQGVQLKRFFHNYVHPGHLFGAVQYGPVIQSVFTGSGRVGGAEGGIGGSGRRVLCYGLLRKKGALSSPTHGRVGLKSTSVQVKIISFAAGFVAPPAVPQFQTQTVYNTLRNLVLNGEYISQFSIVPTRP